MRRLAKRVARQEVQERFNPNVFYLLPIERLFHTGHGKLWNRHMAVAFSHSESVLSSGGAHDAVSGRKLLYLQSTR